jgi:hypothetical protein
MCLIVLAGGCQIRESDTARKDAETAPPVPVEVRLPADSLDAGDRSGLADTTFRVFRNEKDFEKFWFTIHPKGDAIKLPMGVDFRKDMVVFAAIGERPSAGYRVKIERIGDFQGKVTVRVVEQAPTEMAASVMTSPYVFVRTRLRPEPVVFVLRKTGGMKAAADTAAAAAGS